MFLQILESVCSQGFVYLQMVFLMVSQFYFLLFLCPRHCLHIILIGVGTEMTEIKYNGEGIYTMSPSPSMEDRESLIDPQSPYKSSRLDNLLKQSKANYLNALEAEYLRKADCNYSLLFLNHSPIQLQGLPNCDCDGELPSAHAVNMAEIVPGFKGRICGRTSQLFTIGCNSSGEAPETVAVVRPDGEHKVKLKHLYTHLKDY